MFVEDLVYRISTFSVEMQTTVVALSRTDCLHPALPACSVTALVH